MTTPIAETLLTAEEFARTIDPPGIRTELVRGTVIEMPPAKPDHSEMGLEIAVSLRAFARAHALGRVTGEGGFLLSRGPDTVRAPDAAFTASSRPPAGRLPRGAWVEGPPNLAVEVVSPDDRDTAVAAKIAGWLDAGADRVWEVRPRTRTVTVHRPGIPPRTLGDGDTLTSDEAAFSVEGFALAVDSIFD